MHFSKSILLIFIFLSSANLWAQKDYKITDECIKEINLKPFASLLSIQKSEIDINKVINGSFTPFKDPDNKLNYNYYWLKLKIVNLSNFSNDFRLKLFDNWCEEAIVYSRPEKHQDWLIQKAGHLTPLSDLDINPFILVELKKVPNAISLHFEAFEKKEIYIRYTRVFRSSIQINPSLSSFYTASKQLLKESEANLWVIGFMCMPIILGFFHLFFYILVKDSAYLYYAIYGLSVPFALTIMDEFGNLTYHLFYNENPQLQPWIFMCIGILSTSSYIFFTRRFLSTKIRFPKIDKAIIAIFIYGLVALLIHLINFYITGKQYVNGMSFGFYLMTIGLVFFLLLISIWRNLTKTDLFFLAGLAVLLSLMLPFYLMDLLSIERPEFFLKFLTPYRAMHLGIVLELLIFSIGLGFRTNQTKLEKQRFQELDELKSRFFTDIAHEFRTPLTLINGPLESLKNSLTNATELEKVEMAQSHSKGLLNLVNQVMDLSKLEAKKIDVKFTESDVILILKGLFYSFESHAKQAGIELYFKSEKDNLPLFFDKEKMEIIMINLLSNAFKYCQRGDSIELGIKENNGKVIINLLDTGKGIPSNKIEHIFDRYYQIEDEEHIHKKGSGIGLSIVRELMLLQKGTISVDSKLNEYTNFELCFLKGNSHISKADIVDFHTNDQEFLDNSIEDISDKKCTVLVIEDHPDVRAFIKIELQPHFKIVVSNYGDLGVKKALEILPDLIISDVMMPYKNGYELCKELKTNMATSHIPIILLTARSASEEKLEGLESGADDFLLKPFDSKELVTRVRNLIKLRQQLRTRFSTAINIKPSEVSVHSLDQEFMKRMMEIIEENIPNEKFSIDFLAKEVGLSTRQINRKLKALIDKSTNELINSIRLERAAELLRKDAGNVGDIAFKTGFRSTAYFVATFKKHFGIPPGEYKKQA